MATINFRGKDLFYKDERSGIPLIFIHGFCEDNRMWDEFIKLFPLNVRIIRPDLPGFGQSGLPDGEITIDIYAEAVHEILKQEKIANCILVEHSMGGYTALSFIERYADMLLGIVMFHSTAFADDDNKKQDRSRAIDFLNTHPKEIYVDEVYSKLFAPDFYTKNMQLVFKLQKYAHNLSTAGIKGALNAMRLRPDRTSALKQLPVLFITGKKDIAVPYEKNRLQYALPDVSQVLILDEVAHMGMFEAPQECANAIIQFVKILN